MTISKTPLNKEELAEWNNTMAKLFDIMRDMDTAEAMNLMMHMVAGTAVANGVTKENLMEGLDVTYDTMELNWNLHNGEMH